MSEPSVPALFDLTGTIALVTGSSRGMISRGRGKIINIASVQSDLARPGIGPYTAATGGMTVVV